MSTEEVQVIGFRLKCTYVLLGMILLNCPLMAQSLFLKKTAQNARNGKYLAVARPGSGHHQTIPNAQLDREADILFGLSPEEEAVLPPSRNPKSIAVQRTEPQMAGFLSVPAAKGK